MMMKKSPAAVPGAPRAIETAPLMWERPVFEVGSCGIGGSSLSRAAAGAGLDQAPGRIAGHLVGAVEGHAVESLLFDIFEEVGGGDGGMDHVELDGDRAIGGVEDDARAERFGRFRSGRR